jgi:hypothetical protein
MDSMGEGSKSARRGKEPGHGIFSEVQIQRDSERFREASMQNPTWK